MKGFAYIKEEKEERQMGLTGPNSTQKSFCKWRIAHDL
jgi:hypothetical protein